MDATPNKHEGRSERLPLTELSSAALPRLSEAAPPYPDSYNSASSPEVIRRHDRNLAVREKRSKRALGIKAERLRRDGIIARLWQAAATDDPRVAPRVREHFGRCVEACLSNEAVALYFEKGFPAWSERSLCASPVVRVEFTHAFIMGRLGESLSAARNKAWGEFLSIQPLDPRDPIDPMRLVYAFKQTAPYQRRFEQRARLRRMLGKDYAPLVLKALRSGKQEFIGGLTEEQATRIRARTGLGPGRFWRASKGREFVAWPAQLRQLTLFDVD